MKIAYFGSPSFSATLLEKLILDKSLGIEIAFVVTQPDKPVGRKMIMTPSPVKIVAQKYNIPVVESLEALHVTRYTLHDVNLALVYAYGFKQLIPLDLLRAPKMQFEIGEGKTSGFVNVHPSLLPLYRGSSPIAYPILLGENKTGVTLFVMDEKMDHGPIISQEEMEITLTDVRMDMETKLTSLGFEMVKNFLNSLIRESVNSLILKPQLHEQATRSPYMVKDDGFIPLPVLQKALKNEPLTLQELPQIIKKYILRYKSQILNPPFDRLRVLSISKDKSQANSNNEIQNSKRFSVYSLEFSVSPKIIYDFWRGMSPWPSLWTIIQPPRFDSVQKDRTSEVNVASKRLKIINMEYHVQTGHAPSLQIKAVQLEGKSPVDFPTFQKAYKIF